MYNEKARELLEAQRDAANSALNELNPFVKGVADGSITSATVKKRIMDSIKANALKAGTDISTWDGTPEPVPDPE